MLNNFSNLAISDYQHPCLAEEICLAYQNFGTFKTEFTNDLQSLPEQPPELLSIVIQLSQMNKFRWNCNCCKCGKHCDPYRMHKLTLTYWQYLSKWQQLDPTPVTIRRVRQELACLQDNEARLYQTL